MQLDPQVFLRLVEKAKTLCFFDIEATGLKGDYNTILVASFKFWGKRPISFPVVNVGEDKIVVKGAKAVLEDADCWVTYFGKGFDIKMLDTRLLHHREQPVERRPHIDLYYSLKSSLLTGRRSQGHLLSWLELPEQKMGVSANEWATAPAEWKRIKKTMIRRCESDVFGLEALYKRTKHLIRDIKR